MRAAWVLACVGALLVDGSTKAVDAADVLTKAPPPAAPSEYDWTGFYVGGHVAYSLGRVDSMLSDPDPTVSNNVFSGLYGGVQGGYNYVFRLVCCSAPKQTSRSRTFTRMARSLTAERPRAPV